MAFANFRGVYVKGCRDALKNAEIVELKNSANFCIPLKLGKGSESKLLVEVGTNVKAGSVIASPRDNSSGFIYSPVSGNIVKIADGLNAFGDHTQIVEIEPSHKDIVLNFKPIENYTPTNLFGRLIESGSFDTWGRRLPSYNKYVNKNANKIGVLIVKLYDSDGFIYSNATLAKHFAKEVALGASLFYRVAGANQIVFALVDEADGITKCVKEQMASAGIDVRNFKFMKVPKNYPSDYDNLLAKIVTGKLIKIEDTVEENGVVIENAQTCLNFYNAVYKNMPTTKVLYTVSGNNFNAPKLVMAKNGSSAFDLLGLVKIANKDTFKSFSIGGVMCGFAQADIKIGLPLSATSLHSFKDDDRTYEIDCINCGKCNEVCPTRLAPMMLDNFALEKDFGRAKRYGVHACINCGACSFVCPAKRYLAQRISNMKTSIEEGRTM